MGELSGVFRNSPQLLFDGGLEKPGQTNDDQKEVVHPERHAASPRCFSFRPAQTHLGAEEHGDQQGIQGEFRVEEGENGDDQADDDNQGNADGCLGNEDRPSQREHDDGKGDE